MPAQEFIQAVQKDSDLKNKLTNAVNESIVRVAKENGFEISPNELNQKPQEAGVAAAAGCSVQLTKTAVCTF